MDRMERIVRIHHLLSKGRPVPLERMQRELEVSRATVVRDLEYMRDRMGAPVVYDRAANGHRYDRDAPTFELPGLWFNASELYALLASEQLLEAVQPGVLAPHIGPLKARIRSLIEKSGQQVDTVTSRIQLLTSARRRADSAHFGVVAEAVLNARPLDIEYHARSRDQVTKRRVHPYRLVHYRDNWYLVGHCQQARALRLFALDRILHAATADAEFKPATDAAVDRYIGSSFGIFGGEAHAWAILRFTPEAARWVADEEWHPDQIGLWKEGAYELQVPYAHPQELLMDILKYGPDVEVVGPADLRDQVAARVQEAAARYHSSLS
jgi:predicted DNA-binding transcriptional regulator YafY